MQASPNVVGFVARACDQPITVYFAQVDDFNHRTGGGEEKVWLMLCVLHVNQFTYWKFNGRNAGKNLTLMGDLHVARWNEPGWTGYGNQ